MPDYTAARVHDNRGTLRRSEDGSRRGRYRVSVHADDWIARFNTPANFLRVNRGLKARLDLYRGRWADALTALNESFVGTASGTTASKAVVGTVNLAAQGISWNVRPTA